MFSRLLLLLSTLASSMVFAQANPSSESRNQTASVPFVGCEADGQTGPLKAPGGKSVQVLISADAASRLAYYKSEEGLGVLAPRGWHCFGVYGSNGYSLYVSPERITATEVFSSNWKGFAGPAIELAAQNGDTSGRFTVARVIARVFPERKPFVERVIAEGVAPADSFPPGPYPADKLTYRSNQMVEYATPANADGLGTDSRLIKSTQPISGVAILVGETPDLVHLAVRLSPDLSDLASSIIQQLEGDAEHGH
jgi:hypothetical protein